MESAIVWPVVLAIGALDARLKPDERLLFVSYLNADYPLVGIVTLFVTYAIVSFVYRICAYMFCRPRQTAARQEEAEYHISRRAKPAKKDESFVEYARIAMSEVEALYHQTRHFYFDTSKSRDRWMHYIRESFDHGYPFNPHLAAREMHG
jgi:hypothetical protein